MARQRIHNRRAGRGSSGTGASWISYSDMMAALLLIFVLFTMGILRGQDKDAGSGGMAL